MEETTCRHCGETIYLYTHSQAGPIEGKAWTLVQEGSEEDPRYGTRCPERGNIFPHEPEIDAESDADELLSDLLDYACGEPS